MVRGLHLLSAGLALLMAIPGRSAAPPEREAAVGGADFSDVTTVAKAKALVRRGELIRILLVPKEFGGTDIAANRAYIPPYAAHARELLLGSIARFADAGHVDRFGCELDYKGDSIVPSAIRMRAWHSAKKGEFVPKLVVW